jgi:hypothetical protein
VAALKAKAEAAKAAEDAKTTEQTTEVSKSQVEDARKALASLTGIPGMEEEVKAIKAKLAGLASDESGSGNKLSGTKLVKFLDGKITHKTRTAADADSLVTDYEHRMEELKGLLEEAKVEATARRGELVVLQDRRAAALNEAASSAVAFALAPPGSQGQLPQEFTEQPDVAAKLREAQELVKQVHELYAAARASRDDVATPGPAIQEIAEEDDNAFDEDMDSLVDELYVPDPTDAERSERDRDEEMRRGKAALRDKLKSRVNKHVVRKTKGS